MSDANVVKAPSRFTRRRIIKLAVIFSVVLIVLFVATEACLRRIFVNHYMYMQHSNCTPMILYTAHIEKVPGKRLQFRYLGDCGEFCFKSDITLNNMGYYSRYDYSLEKKPGEFRIAVIGGEQTASSVVDVSWPDFLQDKLNEQKSDSGQTFTVINLGQPDTGPVGYLKYWNEEGRRFNPDLVLVNMCETDYYRSGVENHTPPLYRGRKGELENVSILPPGYGGEEVKFIVWKYPGARELSLRDPEIVPGRPMCFFVSDKLIQDDQSVLNLQRWYSESFISGVLPRFGGLTLMYLRGKSIYDIDPHVIRNFDPMPSAPVDKDKLVKFGLESFGKLRDDIPNLIIMHNFHYWELVQDLPYEFTGKVVEQDSRLFFVDMRARVPRPLDEEKLKELYMYPQMTEKWSNKGHEYYAAMIKDLVLEWLANGRDVSKLKGVMKAAAPKAEN